MHFTRITSLPSEKVSHSLKNGKGIIENLTPDAPQSDSKRQKAPQMYPHRK